ncbi:hypothetical protein [Thermovenabulum gondwanense]|nr:hypothetical protein [Thermovenabulum gondwanense]
MLQKTKNYTRQEKIFVEYKNKEFYNKTDGVGEFTSESLSSGGGKEVKP